MVSEEHRLGLYVAVPVYFFFLACATYWAYRRMERMENEGISDKLTAHYLGGRDFGPFLTAGTLFASLFSGYTVIGVPNEAFRLGWESLRWMPTLSAIVLGYFGTGIRLRKSAMLRNHQSPVDFITDRYQSQFLRYTILFLQVLPTLVYLAAQVVAIRGTFNSIFELEPTTAYPVIIIMLMILIFEWLGGLNSVALTDSFQAIIMVLSFITIPLVIVRNFGGWKDLDPESYPQPQFYQTMSKGKQWSFWQFSVVNFAFFTLPHLMQRTYAARDLKSLKMGYSIMCIGPWFTSFVGVFMGTVGVQILADANGGEPQNPASPFTAILEELMNLGGFAKGASIIAITASFAAIMSTADSLIIAISQLLTVELIYPLNPKGTPRAMAWWGRFASLGSVTVALIIGLLWNEGLTHLGQIQFPLSAQAVPGFLFGLYSSSSRTDIHPWCIAVSALMATAYVFVIYFAYLYVDDDDTHVPKAINAGVTGFFLQIFLAIVLELIRRLASGDQGVDQEDMMYVAGQDLRSKKDDPELSNEKGAEGEGVNHRTLLYPGRPEWDIPALGRFGDHALTPKLIWKSMEGINEPMANPWWVLFIFFAITMCTPLTNGLSPPMEDGVFVYLPSVVNGLPWWAFKIIILCIVPTLLILVAIYKMPNEFPIDEAKIEKEGIDPDLVEMTKEELGRRTSYDEQNVLIHRRRSSISQEMDKLGLTESKRRLMEQQFHPNPSQRHLAMLALQSSRDLLSHEISQPIKEEDVDGDVDGPNNVSSEEEEEVAKEEAARESRGDDEAVARPVSRPSRNPSDGLTGSMLPIKSGGAVEESGSVEVDA